MTPDFTQTWPISLRRAPEQGSVTWELIVAGNVVKRFTTLHEDFTPEEALRELLALDSHWKSSGGYVSSQTVK